MRDVLNCASAGVWSRKLSICQLTSVVVSRDPSGACEGGDHSNGLASILQPSLELSFHGKHQESMHPVSSADDFIAR